MTSKMNTKIRLVRCPKCLLVLPELAEVPVYKCGGCGAVLQAKIRKSDANDGAAIHIVQTVPTPKPTPEHASEDVKATNLNQQSTIVSPESPEKNAGRDQYDSIDCTREQPGINHSEEPRSSTEISSHENPESSPEARTLMESDAETCLPDQDDRRDLNECSDSDKEQHGDINMSDGIYSSPSPELNYHHENESLSAQKEVDGSTCSLDEDNSGDRNEFGDSSGELPADLNCHDVEESLQAIVIDTEVKENLNSSAFRSLIAEKLLDSRPRKLASTSQSPLDEDVEQSRSTKFQGFEHSSSANTLEGVPLNTPSFDPGVAIGDMSKSPTTRSYSAYDGSVSSFDGNDDRITDTCLIPRRRNYVVSSQELAKGDDSRGKLGKEQHAMIGGKWLHALPCPTRHGHPVRNMMTLKGDDARPRVPFHARGLRASHGDASTSSLGFSEFQYDSMYHLPAKPDDPESEKWELLRMVRQLQDQLNRANILTGNTNGGFPARVAMKEKQMSSYYDHLAAEREMHHDLNYPRYPTRYDQGKSWSQQFKPSRMAFSGEAVHNRSQVDCSCRHCYSQERHYSAQLPPHDVYCNKGHHGIHLSHYGPYRSGTSSPQHHTGSEFSSWSHETRSNDLWHREDRDMKNHQLPKRHFRPVAGGSPMIACYLCSDILQLPADFLLFKRRYHSLRCSACSKVLKFSFQNRSRLVPYIPESETIAPPPSEVDEYSDPNKARTLGSASRANYAQHAVSVSYSDDYGRSYSKDYSTETDPLSIATPFDRKMSSVSSTDPREDRRNSGLHNPRNHRYTNSVQTSSPTKPSSKKISSEIEEIEETPATSGSPLHRLMGYASPSKVIRGD